MEYREVFRRDGTSTGEIVPKNTPKKPGDYFRVNLNHGSGLDPKRVRNPLLKRSIDPIFMI